MTSTQASSTRSSLSIDTSARSGAPSSSTPAAAAAAAATPTARRNRSALRDYYNLPATSASPAPSSSLRGGSSTGTSRVASPAPSGLVEESSPAAPLLAELDEPGFDTDAFVRRLQRDGSLAEVLRVQAALADETRGLDGERKGLVYDNYGRLIGARDVVGGVGEWLAGKEGVGRLGEVRGGVAAVGKGVEGLTGRSAAAAAAASGGDDAKEVVRWVLAGPERVERLVAAGRRDEAGAVWARCEELLAEWDGVGGVEDVRGRGRAALSGGDD